MHILKLPNELMFEIEDYLSMEDLAQLCLVNQQLHHTAVDSLYTQGNFEALHWAAYTGANSTLERAIKYGADVNRYLEDTTALHLAAQQGHVSTMNLLLQNHATISCVNQEGYNALEIAIEESQIGAVEFLINKQIPLEHIDDEGYDSLHLASFYGNVEIAQLLLKAGMRVEKKTIDNRTSFHIAVMHGHLEVAKLYLQHWPQAQISELDFNFTFCEVAQLSHLEVGRWMLDERLCNLAEFSAETSPLWYAIANNRVSMVELLLERGSSASKPMREGILPLFMAIENHFHEIVKLLLAAGADVMEKTPSGELAISLAATENQHDILDTLIRYAANARPDAGQYVWEQSFHTAIFANFQVVDWCIQQGVSMHSRCECGCGNTALHQAAQYGNQRVVELLLLRGASKWARNFGGDMAVDIAQKLGFGDIADILEPGIQSLDRVLSLIQEMHCASIVLRRTTVKG